MAGGAAYVICFLGFLWLELHRASCLATFRAERRMLQVTLPLLKAKDSEHKCLGVLRAKKVTAATELFSGGLCSSVMQVIYSGTFQGWEGG